MAEQETGTTGEAQNNFPEQLEHWLSSINSYLNEWRASGGNAEIFGGIRQVFNTLTSHAQTAGHEDISRLGDAVERLMAQYENVDTADQDDDLILLNLLEEMHDGLATNTDSIADVTGATGDHLRSLTDIVESLLSGEGNQTADLPDLPKAAEPPALTANDDFQVDGRKFRELLDFSGELELTRMQSGKTLQQMQSHLHALKDGTQRLRNSLQNMELEHHPQFRTRTQELNRQLDSLIGVEKQLQDRAFDFADTLIRQSHLGRQLQSGLIDLGKAGKTMTICHVLLVTVGAYCLAIPVSAIERVMRVADKALVDDGGHRYVQSNDQRIAVVNLIDMVDKTAPGNQQYHHSLVLIRSENRIAAFQVDQFEGIAEVAIRPPGSQLASVRGITGVAVLADSRIVAVVDPAKFSDWSVIRQPT